MLLSYSAWSRRVLLLEVLGTVGCLWAGLLLCLKIAIYLIPERISCLNELNE